MRVEGEVEIKQFCVDFVQNAELMFLMATAACILVIFSLVHFLMALSANYAHIRGHDKFTDLVVSFGNKLNQKSPSSLSLFQDLHNLDVTSESVNLAEMDNNRYMGQMGHPHHHGVIQEYTM